MRPTPPLQEVAALRHWLGMKSRRAHSGSSVILSKASPRDHNFTGKVNLERSETLLSQVGLAKFSSGLVYFAKYINIVRIVG
jgi:hypothetical protein